MKKVIFCFIYIFFVEILFVINISAQFYVKRGNQVDLINNTDSVILTTNKKMGSVIWEYSMDSVIWHKLNIIGDSLKIGIDSTAVYRAGVKYNSCDPILSERFLVGETKYIAEYNTFKVDSSGGVFYLPNNVKFKIPPGAVSDSIYITANILDEEDCYEFWPPDVEQGRVFLGALDIMDYDYKFNTPIKIQFPIKNRNDANSILFCGYNPMISYPMEYNGYCILSKDPSYIEFVTDKLIPVRVEAIIDEPSMLKSSQNIASDESCKEGKIIVKSQETEFNSYFLPKVNSSVLQEGCITISENTEVTFVDCGNITETVTSKEISSKCDPKIEIIPEKQIVKVGEPFKVTVKLSIGDFPLSNQLINVTSSNSLKVNIINEFTDDKGESQLIVTPKTTDNNAKIGCKSDVEYYSQVLNITSTTGSYSRKTGKVIKPCTLNTKIVVYDDCTHPEEWDCTDLDESVCLKIKSLLISKLLIELEKLSLKPGNSHTLNVRALNYKDEVVKDLPVIVWSSSNPNVADVSEGIVLAQNKGLTTINANWCNKQEQNEVYVAEFCDSVKITVDDKSISIFKGDEKRIQLSSTYLDPAKNFAPDIHWKTSDKSIVDVDSGGHITAKGLGNAKIEVSWCDTSVKIPVFVKTKIDKWTGTLSVDYQDWCVSYRCVINYQFTIYWDSMPSPYGVNSSGSLKGTGTAVQTLQQLKDYCTYNENGESYLETYNFTPIINLPNVHGPVWSDEKKGYILFPWYYGMWVCNWYWINPITNKREYKQIEQEIYLDMEPVNYNSILFGNSSTLTTYNLYKFGFNGSGGYNTPFPDNTARNATLTLTRIYSNYEDLGNSSSGFIQESAKSQDSTIYPININGNLPVKMYNVEK